MPRRMSGTQVKNIHLDFLDRAKGTRSVALKLAAWTKPNLRNVKSFVFRAGRQGSTLPRATLFRFGQSHFEPVFNFSVRRDQKRARNPLVGACAILFLDCDMTLGTHPAASKVRQHESTKKAGRNHKHPRAAEGGPRWESVSTSQYQPSKSGFV